MTEAETETSEINEPDEDFDIPLERCSLTFMINLTNIETLGEAVDIAALSIGRYGIDQFYMLATDPDTERQWIIQDGQIKSVEDAEDGVTISGNASD